jgi:hypothetical protein
MTCVGTKRGLNYGLVYDRNGEVVGRVFRHSRQARKALGGGRQTFWTAVAALDGIECGTSLGTRHTSRRSAVAAVREFTRSYPPELLRADARDVAPQWWRGDEWSWRVRGALSRHASRFKGERWDVCALPAAGYAYGCR